MDSILLAAYDLHYHYPGGIQALNGLNLTIAKGRKLAILGANGSGKTTLLLHLNATLKPCQGRILLGGQPVGYDHRSRQRWRSRVGLVLQNPDDQLFSASVCQDVSFGPLNMGLSETETRSRVQEALDALHSGDLAERATHMLSFGQKKRVAIAGILAMRPEILILDEPTAGLDLHGIEDLFKILEELHKAGSTLVLATHDVDLAYTWADQVAVFNAGIVLKQGDPAQVLADKDMLYRARLRAPLILEIAEALGFVDSNRSAAPPRSKEELVTLIRQQAQGVMKRTAF